MRKKLLAVGIATAGAISIFGIINCSKKSDDSTTPTSTTYNYQGPGSHYTVARTDSTYTFTKYANYTSASSDFVVTATAVDINGFKKFTVTNVAGSGGPSVGAIVYGMEVPGMALFLKPVDASNPDQVLTAVASGTCPSSTFSANWVKVKSTNSNVNQANVDTFGTFTYTPTTATSGSASLPAKFSLTAPTTVCSSCGTNTFSSATCSSGVMRVSTGSDMATIYLTSIGAAIVDTADTSGSAEFIFALPTGSITVSSFAGTYSGIYYQASQASGSRLKPVKATLTVSGSDLTGTGYEVTDVANDTTAASGVTLTLTPNTAYPGILTGTMNAGSATNIACAATANAASSGKQVLDCAGVDSGGNGLFNFLLVSR